jgi:hypothetical protein
MSRPVKIISIFIIAAILVAVVLALKARRLEEVPMAQLRLTGYETNSTAQKVAVFELKNPGAVPVDYATHEECGGKVALFQGGLELRGYSTNLLRMTLSERPTRLMVNCSSRHTLRDLGHEILGLVGKRPSTSSEYALFSEALTQ